MAVVFYSDAKRWQEDNGCLFRRKRPWSKRLWCRTHHCWAYTIDWQNMTLCEMATVHLSGQEDSRGS